MWLTPSRFYWWWEIFDDIVPSRCYILKLTTFVISYAKPCGMKKDNGLMLTGNYLLIINMCRR
jgi:hypothetical protein